ncbi:MAG: hypothetical protein P4K80_10180 [Acidobacteriaceae bacterium]|nr:hypothetical protein [Acidobacteriaceae bacterium]
MTLSAGAQALPAGAAPKTMLVAPPAPLLPETLGKLKRVSAGDVGDGLGLVDAADATVLTEDGLRRFARSEYADGPQHGSVTVYKFMDASGAVAAFDYFRRPGLVDATKLGDEKASGAGNEIVFRSGVNVVRESFNLHGDRGGALMAELIDHLPKASGAAGIAPMLPKLVPTKGMDAESVRYALGPQGYAQTGGVLPASVLGFDKNAEVVTARSKAGGTLTLLLYPTPQIAGEHGRAIEAVLHQQGATAGTVKLRREGPLLALTTGAWPATEAQQLIDGIHLRLEVSFDKPIPPEFHSELRKTYSLLNSIAILCGLGALAAVVLGLFFGGGRALIRVMQGKSAASDPEFLRIDLRGPDFKRLRDPKD